MLLPRKNHKQENLEFMEVMDSFLTETTELGHVVLPACTFLEKGGLSCVFRKIWSQAKAREIQRYKSKCCMQEELKNEVRRGRL